MGPRLERQERLTVYLQYVRRTGKRYHSAQQAGLRYHIVEARRASDPQFAADEQEALALFAEDMEQVLIDAALGVVEWMDDPNRRNSEGEPLKMLKPKDVSAALNWLKARNRQVFNPDQRIDVQHSHKVELDMGDFKVLRAEMERRKELQAAILPEQDIVDAEVVEDGG